MDNREIKFRIWDKRFKQFITPKNYDEEPIIYWTPQLNLSIHIDYKDDLIIQQFTGLKDKNGKEIFEGDIVKYEYLYHFDVSGKSVYEVKFENGAFSPLPKDSICDEDDFYSHRIKNYEIIGNIMENPELVKQS